jgi:hypothetical protein
MSPIERRLRGIMTKHSTSSLALFARITLFTSLLLANACSREVPPAWTSDSPASVEAEPAPVQDVTLSLDGDPPLPGEAATGWRGLEQPAAAPDHSGHAGHAGHAEQPTQSKPASKPTPKPKPAPQPEPEEPTEHHDHGSQPEPEEHTDHHDHDAPAEPKGTHHHGH